MNTDNADHSEGLKILHISQAANLICRLPIYSDQTGEPLLQPEKMAAKCYDLFNNSDVIVIDALYDKSFSGLGSDYPGVTLFKCLRLKGIVKHCIIYSVQPWNSILSEMAFSDALKSPGVTLVQFPQEIDAAMCSNLVHSQAPSDMTPYFIVEADSTVMAGRHTLANWWSIIRTYDFLSQLGLASDERTLEALSQAISREESYHGMLFQYMKFKGHAKSTMIPEEDRQNTLTLLKLLKSKSLRVVYVDDHAADGWAYLLQLILYGEERPDLFCVPEIKSNEFDHITLAKEIAEFDPSLVILDIRLLDKDDSAVYKEISGVKLLKNLIYQGMVRCPILAFTASDKYSMGNYVISKGADGFWTKEGIDESKGLASEDYAKFSFSRFKSLLSNISWLTCLEYSSIRHFADRIREIEDPDREFWWMKSRWYTGDEVERTPIARDRIVKELNTILAAHKQFISSPFSKDVNDHSYALLIVSVARVLEIIHPSRRDDFGKIVLLGKRINEEWSDFKEMCYYPNFIIEKRNDIVHGGNTAFSALGSCYEEVFSSLFDYLTIDTDLIREPIYLNGKLIRTKDGKIFFNPDEDNMECVIHENSREACFNILKDSISVSGVRMKVLESNYNYRFLSVAPKSKLSKDELINNYWSAIVTMKEGIDGKMAISLSSITIRKNTMFRISEEQSKMFKPGDEVYFHVKIYDPDQTDQDPNTISKDNKRYFNLGVYDLCTKKPQKMGWSYWRALVGFIKEKENGKHFLALKMLNPPIDSKFKTDGIEYLFKSYSVPKVLFFRPNWRQFNSVGEPEIDSHAEDQFA